MRPNQKLVEFFDQHYLPLRLRSRSQNTVRLYRHTFRKFAEFLGRPAKLSDLTDSVVSRLLSWCREKELSPRTANKLRDQLLAIWRFACRKGVVRVWPDVEPEPEPERIPQAWSPQQLEALFAAIRQTRGWVGKIRADLFWNALHLVLFDTAERIGAVMRLTWGNVDLDSGWVRFPAETRKGGKRDRAYRIDRETIEALRLILIPWRDDVFTWPYDASYIYARYKRVLKRAGLPFDRESMFHRMRRTTASMYELAGGNATDLLGHSSRSVTKKYLDPKICQRDHAIDRLPRPWLDSPTNRDPAPGG